MKELKDLKDVFRRENSTLDAMILTTYTSFDFRKLDECIMLSGNSQTIDLNKIWLFQCNPDKSESRYSKRLYRPDCRLGKTSLSCIDCLNPYLNKVSPAPKKCFHPKVWFLRFLDSCSPQTPVWRMVVSSKNFASGSWKMVDCFYMTETCPDGHPTDLSVFLETLKPRDADSSLWNQMADELHNAAWKDSFTFWYQNGGSVNSPWTGFTNLDELHVLSPFVRDDFRTAVAQKKTFNTVHIYSYEHQIKGLTQTNWSSSDTFHAPPDQEDPVINFHAKIYIWQKDGTWFMCIGSPNATGSAFYKNTEAAVYFTIDAAEKDDILTQWSNWFSSELSPAGENPPPDPETEGAGSQFAAATGDYIMPENLTMNDLQALRAEMLCKIREAGISRLSGSKNRSYWMYLMKEGSDESPESLNEKIENAEDDYPELQSDLQWTSYCESCRSTLSALQHAAPGR